MNVFELEKLHRYVFDIIYDQKHVVTAEEKEMLEKYKQEVNRNPDWRTEFKREAKEAYKRSQFYS